MLYFFCTQTTHNNYLLTKYKDALPHDGRRTTDDDDDGDGDGDGRRRRTTDDDDDDNDEKSPKQILNHVTI